MATAAVTTPTHEQERQELTDQLNSIQAQLSAHTKSLRDGEAKLASLEAQRRVERRPKADGTPVDTTAISSEIEKLKDVIAGLEDVSTDLRNQSQPLAERRQAIELKIVDKAEVAHIGELVQKQIAAAEAADIARRRLQELEGADGRLRQQIAEVRRSRENRLKGLR